MKNFKKQLENQQKINDAVQDIFKFLEEETNFSEMYCTMAQAQTCIMRLMETNRFYEANGNFSTPTDEITNFIYDVSEVYKLLKPFATIMGQVYGEKD